MGYLQDSEKWLGEVLEHLPKEHRKTAVQKIQKKILESYRNGIVTGQAKVILTPQTGKTK